jgi:hypothetical protein
MASWLIGLAVSLDLDELGEATAGNGWSSITSVVVMVEDILITFTRSSCPVCIGNESGWVQTV